MMESCSRSKLKLENHNDRPRLASHWGYNCSIGFDLFFLTFKWHIYHWSILYSPTVWWKKFAAVLWYSPHADDGIEQLGPRLFSIWGNIFPFSVMGGSLGRWRCCVLREVPFASSSDTFFVCGQSSDVYGPLMCWLSSAQLDWGGSWWIFLTPLCRLGTLSGFLPHTYVRTNL